MRTILLFAVLLLFRPAPAIAQQAFQPTEAQRLYLFAVRINQTPSISQMSDADLLRIGLSHCEYIEQHGRDAHDRALTSTFAVLSQAGQGDQALALSRTGHAARSSLCPAPSPQHPQANP